MALERERESLANKLAVSERRETSTAGCAASVEETGIGSGPATVASFVKAIADPVANEQFDKYRHFY